MKKYLLIGCSVILGILIIQSGPFFEIKLSASAFFNNIFDIDFGGREELQHRIEELEKENEALRSTLVETNDDSIRSIKVYSSYPFNSRGEIAIAVGENMGIQPGDTVVYAGNILVGQVRNVFKTSSVVTTIFDPSWQIAVRIGSSEVDALMKGGNELTLSLIPQDIYLETGDSVMTADKNFPYGLELGFVGRIENAEGDVFQEAILEPAFKVKDLRNVAIYR